MTNREIAAVLFNISTILTTQIGNPYRIRAYRRAARNLLRMREQIAQRVARDVQHGGAPQQVVGDVVGLQCRVGTPRREH